MIHSPTSEYEHMLDVLKNFVAGELGVNRTALTAETRIEEDVSIAGLDTYIFYENYFSTFSISNPDDFPVAEYVTSENPWRHAIPLLFSKKARLKYKTKDVTLGHLAHVALLKRWFNPE